MRSTSCNLKGYGFSKPSIFQNGNWAGSATVKSMDRNIALELNFKNGNVSGSAMDVPTDKKNIPEVFGACASVEGTFSDSSPYEVKMTVKCTGGITLTLSGFREKGKANVRSFELQLNKQFI